MPTESGHRGGKENTERYMFWVVIGHTCCKHINSDEGKVELNSFAASTLIVLCGGLVEHNFELVSESEVSTCVRASVTNPSAMI